MHVAPKSLILQIQNHSKAVEWCAHGIQVFASLDRSGFFSSSFQTEPQSENDTGYMVPSPSTNQKADLWDRWGEFILLICRKVAFMPKAECVRSAPFPYKRAGAAPFCSGLSCYTCLISKPAAKAFLFFKVRCIKYESLGSTSASGLILYVFRFPQLVYSLTCRKSTSLTKVNNVNISQQEHSNPMGIKTWF